MQNLRKSNYCRPKEFVAFEENKLIRTLWLWIILRVIVLGHIMINPDDLKAFK